MNKIWICVVAMMFGWGFESQAQRDNTTVRIVSERDKTFSHTIERGQTVYAIATMYGVSTEDIYRLNPDSRNGIKAGDTLLIPQQKASAEKVESASAAQNYTFHTIQKKETLYAVSMRYKVPATEIVKANPGLTTKTFTIGRTIRIPNFVEEAEEVVTESPVKTETVVTEEEYKIARRETMYSLCKKFNISSYELIKRNPVLKKGVKAGTIIYVPVTKTEEVVVNDLKHDATLSETEVNALLDKQDNIEKVNQIKVALLLPFKDGQSSHATARFVEYYEGMLLAVDSLRNLGASINLSVYDTGTGTAKLGKILKEESLKESNLIIGAVQNDQIAQLAQFAETNQIKYVIPFTSKNDNVLSNSMIFQVNTPHSYLYSKAAQAGCELFAEDNIIIVNVNDKDVKKDFISAFKTELKDKDVKFKEVNYNGETFSSDILSLMEKDKKNIVLPSSSSLDALQQIKTPLRSLAETGIEEYDPSKPDKKGRFMYNISLFGYPEWQTYMREALEDFYVLDTYIYTNFYADNLSDRVHNFYNSYKYWYSKTLINTFPKYGILGFDTGMYFLGAIHKYGVNFEKNIDKISYPSLQTGFDFHRVNNWGGFINTNVFIVHYKKDFTVTRDERK